MKNRLLKIVALFLFALSPQLAGAAFSVDGISYDINDDGTTVSVSGNTSYSGEAIIPQSIVYQGNTYTVTSIGEFAFKDCRGLTSVTIPESVTSIGDYAFEGCRGLTSVTIGESVTSIGTWAFSDCTGLTSVTWNARACESIDYSPFSDCTNISTFTFGDSVEQIPNYLCSGLRRLTSITIPESVTEIGNSAFWNCTGLTEITIPEGVTSIGYSVFKGCTGLTSITIPSSVTSIGISAFSGCTGLTSVEWNARNYSYESDVYSPPFSDCTNITTFTFGDNIEQIPNYLCAGLSGLTSITIPESVTTIGNSAFFRCTGLTSITIPESVTSIGTSAFSGCTGLTSVTIPESVTSIGGSAFSGCTGLTSVTIPEGVTSIENAAFSGCTGLTSVKIPEGVTSISNAAFYGCTGLTSVKIPEGVTSIGENAFVGCTGLTSVTWNARNYEVNNPDEALFQDAADNIETFVFGESVEQIPANLCLNMSKLTSVTIPEGVTSIGDYAFSSCSGLTEVTIPASVTSIGDYAFTYCTRLGSVTSQATTPPEIWPNTFDDFYMPLYVPAGTKAKYQAAKYWRNFVNMQETGVNRYTVEVASADEAMGSVMGGGTYDEGETVTLAAIPASGYHFVQWSDGNTDNPRQVTVTEDMSLTAEFSASCKLTVSSSDDTKGSVTAVLTATPKEGYRFVRWNDGNTDNPRTVFVTESVDLVAEFESISTGVEAVSGESTRVYVVGRTLHVENNTDTYRVYTATGQLVYMGDSTTVSLADAGVYLVRTGERSQKVVVK